MSYLHIHAWPRRRTGLEDDWYSCWFWIIYFRSVLSIVHLMVAISRYIWTPKKRRRPPEWSFHGQERKKPSKRISPHPGYPNTYVLCSPGGKCVRCMGATNPLTGMGFQVMLPLTPTPCNPQNPLDKQFAPCLPSFVLLEAGFGSYAQALF